MNAFFTARRIAAGATVALATLVLVAACSASAAPAGAGGYAPAPASPKTTDSATAAPQPSVAVAVNMVQDPTLGPILVDDKGMALYLYKPDGANQSVCTGGCAKAWPPLVVNSGETVAAGSGVTGRLTTFARADGSMQVAYDGTPLYYYAADSKAGDTTGQGVGGVWFVLKP